MGKPPKKGTPEYDAWRQKISQSLEGNTPWNKGKATGIEPPNKGIPMSDEQKAKLSATKRGKTLSEEHKQKISEANKGRVFSPESRAKISAAQKGKPKNTASIAKMAATKRGKPSNRKGVTLSETTRKKLAESGKSQIHPRGYKHGEAFRAKASTNNIKRWQNATEDERRAHLDKLHEGARHITDSSVENAYAETLDNQGIVYERQKRVGWYKVDFYIPAEHRIIEVNGCYWHCCEQCGYANAHIGKREADAKRYDYLQRKGYTVGVIWEHELPRGKKAKDRGG